jgi:hypothetical protein
MPALVPLLLALAAAAPGAPVSNAPVVAFAPGDVHLLAGPFHDAQQRGLACLLSLDPIGCCTRSG